MSAPDQADKVKPPAEDCLRWVVKSKNLGYCRGGGKMEVRVAVKSEAMERNVTVVVTFKAIDTRHAGIKRAVEEVMPPCTHLERKYYNRGGAVDSEYTIFYAVKREIGSSEADVVAKATALAKGIKDIVEDAMRGLPCIEVEFTV